MSGPRDGTGLPYPVNPLTGQPLQPNQLRLLELLRDTSFMVRTTLHQLDGSSFQAEISPNFEVDDYYSNRDLTIAAVKLDELLLWAAKAVLGTR